MNYYGFRVRLTTDVTEIRCGTLVRRSIDELTHALLSSPIAHARVYTFWRGNNNNVWSCVGIYMCLCVYSVLVYISVLLYYIHSRVDLRRTWRTYIHNARMCVFVCVCLSTLYLYRSRRPRSNNIIIIFFF